MAVAYFLGHPVDRRRLWWAVLPITQWTVPVPNQIPTIVPCEIRSFLVAWYQWCSWQNKALITISGNRDRRLLKSLLLQYVCCISVFSNCMNRLFNNVSRTISLYFSCLCSAAWNMVERKSNFYEISSKYLFLYRQSPVVNIAQKVYRRT